MIASTSRPIDERDAAASAFPSVARLIAVLTLISIGSFSGHYTGFPSEVIFPLSICAAGWLFTSRAEWQRRVPARELLGVVAIIGALVALIVITHGKEFPGADRFVRHPIFLASFWLLTCSLYLWHWRTLRRGPRASSNDKGNA